jgi:hypothetical protein
MSRIRVLDDGVLNGKALGTTVLLDISDKSLFSSLRDAFKIIEDENTYGHCMCLGDYAIEFYNEQQLMATIGLHHGRSIRWDAWQYDAVLQDGLRLLHWLADRGVDAPLEAYQQAQLRAEKYYQAMIHWQQAIPVGLETFWDRMQKLDADVEALHKVLEIAYPDPEIRALELFRWFGNGEGKWSGFPAYESVPESLLLEIPTDLLVNALTKHTLTLQHIEGAARYFAGWEFSRKKHGEIKQIPEELKKRLLEHSLLSSDQDKLHRAKRAFN